MLFRSRLEHAPLVEICDVLTVLDQGRVLETGTVEQIQKSRKVQEVYLTRV